MRHRYILRITVVIVLLILGFNITGPLYSKDPIKIVPLGNSITSARVTSAGANSYRRNLWHKMKNAGYDVDFVGSQDKDHKGGTYPDASFDHDHEGHWGWRADQILADLGTWLGGYTPDIALIHLGSNDIIQDNTIASTIDEIEAIINILRNDNSDITIFLAQILPLPDASDNTNVNLLNSELIDLASTMNQAQSRIILVDQNSGWDIASNTYDDIHPNTTGEEIMAQRWFDAFDDISFQNKPPEIIEQNTLSTNEDAPLVMSVSDFVIVDPDTDPSDFVLAVEDGDNYSISGNKITPSLNWNGTLSVPVRVSDGTNNSNRFDALVTVDAVNDAPEITGQAMLHLNEDTSLQLTLEQFSITDIDTGPENLELFVQQGENYTHTETTLTPSKDYHGNLAVNIHVSDGNDESNTFTAIVTVNPVNDLPAITDIPDQIITQGESFEVINLNGHVSDVETPDDLITWTVVGALNLEIEIVNQVAEISPVDDQWSGIESVLFSATDDDPSNPLSISDEVQFTINSTTGLNRIPDDNLKMYPNPANDFVYFEFGNSASGSVIIEIATASGAIVLEETIHPINRNTASLNIENLSSGTYIVNIVAGDQITERVLIKY